MNRQEIRHAAARLLGDLTLGVVASATTTSCVDTRRVEPDDHWRGASFLVYDSDVITMFTERIITSNDESATSLTTSPSWGVTLTAGDKYELTTIPCSEYNAAIDQSLQEVYDSALIKATSTTKTLNAQEVDLSSLTALAWTHLYEVQIDRGYGWEIVDPRKWKTVEGSSLLHFDYNVYSSWSGKSLRLFGLKHPTLMGLDTTVCDLKRPMFLVYRTARMLLTRAPKNFDAQEMAKLAAMWQAEAESERSKMKLSLPPNTRVL